MASNSRHLHLRLALKGTTRTDTYEGRDYLVVPVVALVEGVIHAVNAPTPELVLAEEFTFAADAWNGRPVMFDHPIINGEQVSANSPDILAKSGIGLIFNTKVSNKQLEMEAWLDSTKIADLGGDIADVETRVKAGETLEISVGAFVKTEPTSGVKNGQAYEGIWRNIVPDHLAFLPAGATGACSVAMGCGASRAAAYITTAKGFKEVDATVKRRSLRERLVALLPMRQAVAGWSQNDIRDEIREALKSIEPLYQYIEDVWEEDGYVVYSVWSAVEGGTLSFDAYGYPVDPYRTKMYHRDFTMTTEGEVTFTDTRFEVETVISFEPVTATGTEPRATQSCQHCGGSAATQHDGDGMDKKERIATLMAHAHNPIKEEAALMALTDDGLKALEASCKKAKEADEKRIIAASDARTAEEKQKDELLEKLKTCTQKVYSEADLKAMKVEELQKVADLVTAASAQPEVASEEDWMKSAPENVRSMVLRFQTAEQKQKDELIASLKTAQKVYSEDELKKLNVEELQRIATLSNVETAPVDFSARASARAESGDVYSQPPDGYAEALKAGEVK